jgi:hypothetical protein
MREYWVRRCGDECRPNWVKVTADCGDRAVELALDPREGETTLDPYRQHGANFTLEVRPVDATRWRLFPVEARMVLLYESLCEANFDEAAWDDDDVDDDDVDDDD